MCEVPEWDEEDGSDTGLELDNELLKAKLGLSEEDINTSKHTTPYIENRFLRGILAFQEAEEGPQREIGDLFPDGFEFPPVESLSKAQLKEKLRIIEEILGEHGVFLDLTGSPPNEVVYGYFVNEAIREPVPLEMAEGFGLHLDGCDGYCPECFQWNFCDVGKEIWAEDSENDPPGAAS